MMQCEKSSKYNENVKQMNLQSSTQVSIELEQKELVIQIT